MSIKVDFDGNLGRDPEAIMRGDEVLGVRMSVCATNRKRVTPGSDEWEDDGAPIWMSIAVWQSSPIYAEVYNNRHLYKKGTRVRGSGSLRRYAGKDGRGDALEISWLDSLQPAGRSQAPARPSWSSPKSAANRGSEEAPF